MEKKGKTYNDYNDVKSSLTLNKLDTDAEKQLNKELNSFKKYVLNVSKAIETATTLSITYQVKREIFEERIVEQVEKTREVLLAKYGDDKQAREIIEQETSLSVAKGIINEKIESFKLVTDRIKETRDSKNGYKDLIGLIVKKGKQKNARKIIANYLGLIDAFEDVYIGMVEDYLIKEKGITSKIAFEFGNYLQYHEGQDELVQELVKILDSDHKLSVEDNLVLVTMLISTKLNITLLKLLEREQLSIQVKKQNKLKIEQIALPLEYDDYASVTDTPLLNSLAVIENTQSQQLELLKNYDFKIKTKSAKKSEKAINRLNELDRFVLDTIVIDFYFKRNVKEFSDRQIFIQYTAKYGKERALPNTLKEINKSIEKLRKFYIELDYESIQRYKKGKIQVSGDNPLIDIRKIKVKTDTISNYYRILDEPFYLAYLIATGSPIYTYNRELLYRDIKGMDKSEKWQRLRRYIIRKLTIAKETKQQECFISFNELYTELDINSSNFPKDTNLRKNKQLARDKALLYLHELMDEYSFKEPQLDNESRLYKGYRIKFI